MESRHHHHSLHSCHLKGHHNSAHGGFERYGGFPQLSRIFPPVSSSSSSSSTDSDIHVSRRFRVHRKWLACVLVAVLFIGIGAAVGIYFGYQFLSLTPAMEQVFRGSFVVVTGDTYDTNLTNQNAALFQERASMYKDMIDSLYSQSLVKNAFLGTEILAFDGLVDGPMTVFFNLHVDTHRIRVDAGDLFIIFADAIRNSDGVLRGNITVDQDTLEIQERSMTFLYLPSTERTYVVIGNGPRKENTTTMAPTTTPTSPTTTNKSMKTFRDNQEMFEAESEEVTVPTTTMDTPVVVASHPICVPMNVDFCSNVSAATMQNIIDEKTLEQLRSVVNSQCYPFAAHFLCSWGVACKQDALGDNLKEIMPCRDYCDEFMANCGHRLPHSIKEKIQCGGDWKGLGSCVTKPGCVKNLYTIGQGHRICDGVMDCVDFSDELHCPYCPPGNFHCGAGKECIPPEKKCDGIQDCPNGSDEKACLTLAPSSEAAGYVHQYFNEGYLFVHDQGKLGKLCVERNDSKKQDSFWEPESQLLLDNIGSSACELLGFRKVAFVRVQPDTEISPDGPFGNYVRIQEPGSSSEVTFTAGPCPSKKVLYVGCNHLECGQRPSHLRNTKGQVGHGDWPWHAALLKDGNHVCDATLVTSQWLLTSDQCFNGKSKARWTVHFGRVRMTTTSPWQQERRVVGMVKSPLGDSLVLIKMASPVIFSDFARHVCLPDEPNLLPKELRFAAWEKTASTCIRLGWSKEDELLETRMHQLGSELCQPGPSLANATKSPLCFENDGRDCLKELKVYPGGPVFCQNEESKEWSLAGIAPMESRPKCGIEKYRVSAVAGSTEWILKTIDALSNVA
ncbi:unnamed protein product [Allacma fusca]|uniref:Atrial natriuretic peptide-converting enzyme n=1 Tax=Allacma fusca TaxID=39272 RepID=A0A8J2J1C9_9HEXA|nr:unnamed protein product [Allacma fusca]